jgi:hypothetical protein
VSKFKLLLYGAIIIAITVIFSPPAHTAGGRQFTDQPCASDMSGEINETVSAGLEYLKRRRNSNGSFGANYPVATTGLAGLAFLASGSGYLRGPYGKEIESAAKYFINEAADRWGYFSDGQSRMHGHGYATTFLAEVYGQFPPVMQEKARRVIKKAVDVILRAQTNDGGWGYYPKHTEQWGGVFDEASITVTMAQALRAARNAGFFIDKKNIDLAIDYVRKCATKSGFRYTLKRGGRTTYSLTTAAVSVLNAAGVYESEELRMGLSVIRRAIAARSHPSKAAGRFFYYGNLYAAQAMWQSSLQDWKLWYPMGFRDFLNKQNSDGSWGGSSYGSTYSTSIALLIFQVPYQYLPLFQK